jgi:uncharacterized protein (TIGR03086 family)
MAEPADLVFARGLDGFGAVVDRLGPADWDRATACDGWTALDVLGHLGTSIRMGVSLLRGEQPTWPDVARPADLVDGDPAVWGRATAAEARDALDGAELDLVMDTPMGPRTVADRLAFPAIDLWVHAWDIGHPAGIEVEVPADVVEFAHAFIDPIPEDKVRGAEGAFGAEVAPPAGATTTEAFIAWTGRPPR